MDKAELKSLTGLRGVAALYVAGYHLLLPGALIGGLTGRLLARGYLAVDLFFVLSGFVLALNYGSLFAGPRRLAALPGFLWRRWGRIFPLYGLILVVRLAYTWCRYGSFGLPRPWIAAPSTHPWTDVPANLLLVQSWHVAPSLIGPAWSVSTEWAAYWAFPALAAILLHARPRVALAGAALAVGCLFLAASGSQAGLDCWDGQGWGPLLRCLAGFTLGMGLWRLSRWPPAARLAARPEAGWAACAGLLAGCGAGLPDLMLYPLLPALVLCLAVGARGPARCLASPLAVWLGEVSYALYLLHIFLLHPLDQARAALALLLPPAAANGAAACACLALLLAASELAHRHVERPARRWAAALAGRFPPVVRGCGSFLTPVPLALRTRPLPVRRALLQAAELMTARTVR